MSAGASSSHRVPDERPGHVHDELLRWPRHRRRTIEGIEIFDQENAFATHWALVLRPVHKMLLAKPQRLSNGVVHVVDARKTVRETRRQLKACLEHVRRDCYLLSDRWRRRDHRINGLLQFRTGLQGGRDDRLENSLICRGDRSRLNSRHKSSVRSGGDRIRHDQPGYSLTSLGRERAAESWCQEFDDGPDGRQHSRNRHP